MNARPLRRFIFRLAGHLGMTVRELETRMDSRELSEWIAFDRYSAPIGFHWLQTGYVVSAALAPHSKRTPKPTDFVPVVKPPMHQSQINEQIELMKADLGIEE